MEGVYINRQMGVCNRFVCPFLRPIRQTLLPTTKVYMKAAVNIGSRTACSHFIQSWERSTVLFLPHNLWTEEDQRLSYRRQHVSTRSTRQVASGFVEYGTEHSQSNSKHCREPSTGAKSSKTDDCSVYR